MTHYTTLNAIRAHRPSERGWNTLLAGLGKTEPDDEPLAFTRILKINGIVDAIWALCCHPDQMLVRSYACDCAERVVPMYEAKYPGDDRVRECIATARRYIAGDASDDETRAARAAAHAAAADAARAASVAADAAAYAAAHAAAGAARAAAYAAAHAARGGADAAAHAAAAAVHAAVHAAYAAYAAADAHAVERNWQTQRYIEVFGGAK